MAFFFAPFSDESLRISANLEQRHDSWVEAVRRLDTLPSSMYWVTKGGREYLGIKQTSSDPGTTAGVRDAESESRFNAYQAERAAAKTALASTEGSLGEAIRQYRALRLPMATPMPARILRELDIEGLLGADLMLVGTNAFAAYELAATCRFPPEHIAETEDFDMAWCRGSSISLSGVTTRHVGVRARRLLQQVSPVFPEQEWLIRGIPVRAVAVSRDNKTCPIFAPDPRWMALHKLWLAEKPDRDPRKKPKDRQQGDLLLDAVAQRMGTSHPLNLDFVLELPEELLAHFNRWAAERKFIPGKATQSFR